MADFDWVCPHCQHAQIVGGQNYEVEHRHLRVGTTADGDVGLISRSIRCSNVRCNQLTLSVFVVGDRLVQHNWKSDATDLKHSWDLLPESSAKPQPDYIPAPLREDYLEACLIRDKSPKAAATLVRRCLQGMIRDFCAISRRTLFEEISALREAVDNAHAPAGVTHETVDAIDHVRGVGNIGAHMEADINLIVDVEAGEAQALIELVEMLFDEWYVARHRRQERLAGIAKIGAEKKAAKSAGTAAEPNPPGEEMAP